MFGRITADQVRRLFGIHWEREREAGHPEPTRMAVTVDENGRGEREVLGVTVVGRWGLSTGIQTLNMDGRPCQWFKSKGLDYWGASGDLGQGDHPTRVSDWCGLERPGCNVQAWCDERNEADPTATAFRLTDEIAAVIPAKVELGPDPKRISVQARFGGHLEQGTI